MKERPLWRWLLFCAALRIYALTDSRLALDVVAWAVLPAWLGYTEGA